VYIVDFRFEDFADTSIVLLYVLCRRYLIYSMPNMVDKYKSKVTTYILSHKIQDKTNDLKEY